MKEGSDSSHQWVSILGVSQRCCDKRQRLSKTEFMRNGRRTKVLKFFTRARKRYVYDLPREKTVDPIQDFFSLLLCTSLKSLSSSLSSSLSVFQSHSPPPSPCSSSLSS